MLAAFGTPWPDARNLTISFPSDDVRVGKFQNDIEQTLDQVALREEWQELALRAYQTWAINADINVGLRNDHDVSFGVPGLTTGDPRFGEFRIGAFPQEGLLASSVPFQAVAGTYSGELLLNSNEQFKFHDWSGDLPPDPNTLAQFDRDLFSVLLHEVGNTLGVEDSLSNWTVMFGQYAGPKGVLTPEDIADIQALYGARSDPYEQVDNGQLLAAELISTPVGFDANTDVVRSRGSLVTGTDVDYYKIVPVSGFDSVTIRLQASGVSLLKSQLEVIDDAGNVIDSVAATSVFDNDNTLQISGLLNHSAIYIRVAADDPADIYSVGDYELQIDYRSASVQAADPVSGAYDSGGESLFTHFPLQDSEIGTNDTVSQAGSLSPETSVSSDRYEVHSSVSSGSDVDLWKVTAPSVVQGRLVTHVSGVGLDSPDVRIRVVDSAGIDVGTAGRLRPDGTWTMEVAQPVADQDYFLRVSVDPSSSVGVGNYVATAEFEAPSDQMNHLVSGDVSDAADDFVLWTASKTKLYRFDLAATNTAPGESIRLTIYDAHTKEPVMAVSTRGGITRAALGWLEQGDYILRFEVLGALPGGSGNIGYSLTADGISDDQDDENENGEYEYTYENYGGTGNYGYYYNGYYYYYYP